jgi:hypothetical protein
MRERGRGLLLGIVLLGGVAGDRAGAAEPAAGRPFAVVCWPAESSPAMVAEVERLMSGHIALDHRRRSEDGGCVPDAVWISFTRSPRHVPPAVLALADPHRRLIAVYSDRLQTFIGEHLRTVVHDRAVGRVVAHEIGHVVAGHGHGGHGLMRPRFSKEMLVGLRPLPRS